MEDKCLYISSRGLLKSCDVHNTKIGSSDVHLDLQNYLSIKKNDIVYENIFRYGFIFSYFKL